MPSLHILIPHALVDDATETSAAKAALESYRNSQPDGLPQLQRLLRNVTWQTQRVHEDGAVSAHEHVQASARGLETQAPPWAALRAHALQLPGATDAAWAFVTPAHWALSQGVGPSQLTLSNPQTLQLDASEAHAFYTAMRPYFAEDGIALHEDNPAGPWLASGDALRELRSPTPERVLALGGDVAPWLPTSPLLRRLQNEMQMLLYTHPVNDAREQRGQQSVNAFWLHGCGVLSNMPAAVEELTVLDGLGGPALRGDWRAWAEAWRSLDARLAALLSDQDVSTIRLTLCGLHTLRSLDLGASATAQAGSGRGGFWRRWLPGFGAHRANLAELLITV